MNKLLLFFLISCAMGPSQELDLIAPGFPNLENICEVTNPIKAGNLIPYEKFQKIQKKYPKAIGINANFLLNGQVRVLAVTKNFFTELHIQKNIEINMDAYRFVEPYKENKEFSFPIKTTIDHSLESLRSCALIDFASTQALYDPHGHAYITPPFLTHIIIPE